MQPKSQLAQILKRFETDILAEWVAEQLRSLKASGQRSDAVRDSELREDCRRFYQSFADAASSANASDVMATEWSEVRDVLTNVSRSRAIAGFSPSETARFVFSLKRPLFQRLGQNLSANGDALFDAVQTTSDLLDKLGLLTTEIYQKGREEVISRQQTEMLELSTPVVKLWDGVLALPMIGTLDSYRTQSVMEALLVRIMETGSRIAIIDITGVPTVDTLVAQHLMKTVAAARLMGADCIISGIRPQIAQTIVHLAIDLGNITTKATLADAFAVALERLGKDITDRRAAR